MNIFNGEKPEIASSNARRSIDLDAQFQQHMLDESIRLRKILDSGYRLDDTYFKSSRGLTLGTRTFVPPSTSTSPNSETGIVFMHGYTDNLRWGTMRTMMTLAENGFFVTGVEHEGHGLSDSIAGLFKDINLVVQDSHEFIKFQQEKYPHKNWFLFGESLGGMVAILESIKAVEKKDINLNGMVLIAPMCKIADTVRPHPLVINILKFASFFCPKLSLVPTAMSEELVFKTKEIIEKQQKDPVRYVGRPRLATALTMFNSTIWLENNMDKVTLPFIALHGKEDVVTPYEGTQDLFDKSVHIPTNDKSIILPAHGWHGLLQSEPVEDMDRYWLNIFTWIKSRVQ